MKVLLVTSKPFAAQAVGGYSRSLSLPVTSSKSLRATPTKPNYLEL